MRWELTKKLNNQNIECIASLNPNTVLLQTKTLTQFGPG